jgi:hypothetical protein
MLTNTFTSQFIKPASHSDSSGLCSAVIRDDISTYTYAIETILPRKLRKFLRVGIVHRNFPLELLRLNFHRSCLFVFKHILGKSTLRQGVAQVVFTVPGGQETRPGRA